MIVVVALPMIVVAIVIKVMSTTKGHAGRASDGIENLLGSRHQIRTNFGMAPSKLCQNFVLERLQLVHTGLKSAAVERSLGCLQCRQQWPNIDLRFAFLFRACAQI